MYRSAVISCLLSDHPSQWCQQRLDCCAGTRKTWILLLLCVCAFATNHLLVLPRSTPITISTNITTIIKAARIHYPLDVHQYLTSTTNNTIKNTKNTNDDDDDDRDDRHRVDLHVHAWGARLLATLAAQPSVAADALQALKPRGAEAAGVEAQEGKTTMLLPRLYAGLQKGLEDTGRRGRLRWGLLRPGCGACSKGWGRFACVSPRVAMCLVSLSMLRLVSVFR